MKHVKLFESFVNETLLDKIKEFWVTPVFKAERTRRKVLFLREQVLDCIEKSGFKNNSYENGKYNSVFSFQPSNFGLGEEDYVQVGMYTHSEKEIRDILTKNGFAISSELRPKPKDEDIHYMYLRLNVDDNKEKMKDFKYN